MKQTIVSLDYVKGRGVCVKVHHQTTDDRCGFACISFSSDDVFKALNVLVEPLSRSTPSVFKKWVAKIEPIAEDLAAAFDNGGKEEALQFLRSKLM